MARINIAVDAGLAQDLAEEARRQNKTLYAISNEAVQVYLKLCRTGRSPEQVYRILEGFEFLRAVSAVPVPETLLDKMLQLALKSSREEVLRAWYEVGKVFGELVRSQVGGLDGLSELVKRFRELLPISLLELNLREGEVEVVMTGTGYSLESATCTSEGLRGFLEAFGLSVQSVEVASGFVKAQARMP